MEGDRNQTDAESIDRILEEEVRPIYYKISGDGLLHDWGKVMKQSMRSSAAKFSARRMVKEYARNFYGKALKEA